ncbi:MAG: dihydroxy-acid dehydratase, partial [Chloroflexota bacterium]|nr:dihydroxy-acid dehydratase [Dehalococcoidia bacterium]MDW8048007.1 dihydroxy-acid dehydratase [Chloroflexota bacterium]
IVIDVNARRLDVELDDAELARRRAAWQPPAPKYTVGAFAKYARIVASAADGAVTAVDLAAADVTAKRL